MTQQFDPQLRKLSERAGNNWMRRAKYLESFGSKTPNRIATDIYAESAVHLLTLSTVTVILIEELRDWYATKRPEATGVGESIERTGFQLALQSLEECVELMGVDQTKQLIEISYSIGKSVSKLFGGDIAILIFESAEALRDSGRLFSMKVAEPRTASKFLLELDLFMMTALASCQHAAAQVHAISQPLALDGLTFEEGSRAAADRAKAFVVAKLKECRGQIRNTAPGNLLEFPEDGFWSDAK